MALQISSWITCTSGWWYLRLKVPSSLFPYNQGDPDVPLAFNTLSFTVCFLAPTPTLTILSHTPYLFDIELSFRDLLEKPVAYLTHFTSSSIALNHSHQPAEMLRPSHIITNCPSLFPCCLSQWPGSSRLSLTHLQALLRQQAAWLENINWANPNFLSGFRIEKAIQETECLAERKAVRQSERPEWTIIG